MSTTNSYTGNTDISPKVDFEEGINLGYDVVLGNDAKEEINKLPENYKSSPVTYALELRISNPEDGQAILATLEEAKSMIFNMIPPLEEMVNKGGEIKFRHVGYSVFVEASLVGEMADLVLKQTESFSSIENTGFNMVGTGKVSSGLTLDAPFEISLEDIIKQATQFKVVGEGKMEGLKEFISGALKTIESTYSHMIPTKIRSFLPVIKALCCFKKFEYTCKYDSDELANVVKELAGTIAHNSMGGEEVHKANPEMGLQMLSGVVAQGQSMGKQSLDAMKGMVLGLIAPFIDSIKKINLDKITMCFVTTKVGGVYKFHLNLVGLTSFLAENVFE